MLEISTDAHILAACKEDPERFRELFERHFPSTLAFLRRRVGDHIAEDLAIETFALAFSRRGTYDVAKADSLVRDSTMRAEAAGGGRQSGDSTGGAARATGGARTVYEPARVDAAAAGPALALALATLRSDERDVLLLFAWAELTYAEIAEALGVPVGTVRSRLSRARARFRELLSANGQLLGEEPNDGMEER